MNPVSWLDTQELITEALQRSPGDREQFLRERCADPVLRERISTLLDATRTSDTASIVPPDPQDDGYLPAGSRVGPYIVLRRLGRGGMGEVFLGRDPRLDRQVALKCLISSRTGGQDLRDHVIREARAAARIMHANVAAVHDVVEHDGRMFIVMEYVEGESLAALLKREALSPERVLSIGRQLAGALAAAHSGGVIHRDLKPSNIQVTPDGSVKVLDFGIAMALATIATTSTRTNTDVPTEHRGPQPGTPAYMSPEALVGRRVDERSDLFSLAVVLFEMATGRRPLHSTDPLAAVVATIKILPRADSIDRRVPEPLADVIEKGLAADPGERFQSASEMRSALDAVRDELFPTSSRSAAGVATGQPRIRRIAWVVAAFAPAPIVLWFLGRVSSAAFNITLGRTGAFAHEPVQAHIVWGARSIVAPCVYAALAVASVWTIRFVVRLLSLSGRVERALQGVRGVWHEVSRRLVLDDPRVLAQGLAALGIPTLAIVVWRFSALMQAWGTMINTTPVPEQLWLLSPANEDEKVLYRAVLTILLLAFAAGFWRVLQLRAELGTRHGGGGIAAVIIVIASLLLLNEVPYRILWKSQAERIEYGGRRCYIIGEAGTEWLVYCPDSNPPRNRVLEQNDPGVQRTGARESIFTQATH